MYYTTADEVLIFQQHHDPEESIIEAMRQVAFEDVLSSVSSGLYSSIWTFADRSRLYLEGDEFYKVSDSVDYTPDEGINYDSNRQ